MPQSKRVPLSLDKPADAFLLSSGTRCNSFQKSRAFLATKKVFTPATCKWSAKYSVTVNAPRRAREDEWKLVA